MVSQGRLIFGWSLLAALTAGAPGCGSVPQGMAEEGGSSGAPVSEPSGAGPAPPGAMPLGIPAPAFGINEVAPAPPSPWTSNVSGFFFVQSGGSNESNGFPGSPRGSVPSTLPAGSVVIIAGTYDVNHEGGISANGTASAPVFVKGTSNTQRATITQKWQVSGSYFVIEYINATWANSSGNGKLEFGGHHAAVRHGDFRGDTNTGVGGVFPYGNDLLVWDNFIHDAGDVNATFDQDNHCIKLGTPTSNVWILDNEIARCSGDSIQIGDNSSASEMAALHHIYIGRNNLHHSKQSGVGTKAVQDIVISQNKIHDFIPSGSSPGTCAGGQYGPTRVWYLLNEIYNCLSGIRYEGDSGFGSGGGDRYIIGNVFRNISGGSDAENPHAEAAIAIRGGTRTYIVNNTMWSYQAGIKSPSDSALFIENNIMGGRNQAANYDLYVELGAAARASTFRNNLVDPAGFKAIWANEGPYRSLSSFRASTGVGQESLQADPRFISPQDFHLRSESPAKDAGLLSDVYSQFERLYGLSIAKDFGGKARPVGGAWDIGAFEFGP